MSTALGYVASQGDVFAVQELVSRGAPLDCFDGWSPLFWACRYGHLQIVEILIEAGARIDSGGGLNDSALHMAAGNGNTEVIRALLKAGAPPSPSNERGYTPLHEAAWGGHISTLVTLIISGADLHKENYRSYTPLDVAIKRGHRDAVAVLLASGAEIHRKRIDQISLTNKISPEILDLLAKKQNYKLKTLCARRLLNNKKDQIQFETYTGLTLASCLWQEVHVDDQERFLQLILFLRTAPTMCSSSSTIISKSSTSIPNTRRQDMRPLMNQ